MGRFSGFLFSTEISHFFLVCLTFYLITYFTSKSDPSVVEHFFTARDDQMSQKEVYEFNVPTFGKGVVYDVPLKVRDEQFRMYAFGPRFVCV